MNRQDLENVADISKLYFEDNDAEQFQNRLNAILDYVGMLNKIDTSQVEPTIYVLPLKNVTRKDEVKPSLPREVALAGAPEQEDGYFKVAKIMEN